jgi:hypothetical protein
MNKKFILVFLVIAVGLAVAAAYWFFVLGGKKDPVTPGLSSSSFFPDSSIVEKTSDSGLTPDALNPDSGEKVPTLSVVVDTPVSDFWMDNSDQTLYTITSGGVVTATPHGGSKEVAYSGDGRPLLTAQASDRGDLVILTTGNQKSPTISVINLFTKKRIFLPIQAKNASWHPNGKDVLFLRDGDSRNAAGMYSLNVAKESFSLISPMSLLDVKIFPKSSKSVLLISPSSKDSDSPALLFDLTTKKFSEFIPRRGGLQVSWSLAGKYGLTSSYPNNMSLISDKGEVAISSATLPQKCAMLETAAVCGVPDKIASQLPDSYLKKAHFTIDTIYAFQLDGKEKRIWSSSSYGPGLDILNPKKIGTSLYFINRYDNKLYSLDGLSFE